MSEVGTAENPLRVAIIGAGPAGFYAAEHLFKQKMAVQVDMYDRLPTPFGLVRNGVAPDHQKIKSVTAVFDRTAKKPGFRFFGNVELGRDVSVDDLRDHYHQIVYTTGAQTDRALNVPGADLEGHHPATEFVAWYNGHPDFRDLQFDLSQEKVAVIGIGNVAMDVARILCRTPAELAQTDIADYALEALSKSNVKEVYVLGRRGPAQAAFTTPEIKELGEMEDTDTFTISDEVELDSLSEASLAESADRGAMRKVEIIQSYAQNQSTGKSRKLFVRFLVSPVELYGDEHGHVKAMKLVHNELYKTDAGSLRPRATERTEVIEVGLVFRSIGYRGVPLSGVPFNDSWGVILNDNGRVIHPDTKEPVTGEYTAGWVKRGPSGVIGTNKPDSVATVDLMMADLQNGRYLHPTHPEAEAIASLIAERQPQFFSYADWQKLDELETAKGAELGRPRLKFTCVEDMLAAVGKA
ncbi:MAG: FAD-dependent oxidoreductase [Anaerolineales bacterium]|nr:FAD-dependent oxidoreductase [Anaerolineales bacterium]MCB8966192.1 FAD-dependent oxidoreductase [Ardenticatenaceae bacterium]